MIKPQLVIQDFGGVKNKDLKSTSAALLKGGSWKRQRIVVILPAGESIPAKVALSHWNLVFPPNNGVVRILAQGMEVGDAYSVAIEQIIAHPEFSNWEYILTIEHDNMPPQDGVIKLIEQMENHPELDCIGGLYFTKGEGGVAQIWGDPKDPVLNFRPQPPDPNGGLVECCGTGMGFNLWRMKMFKDDRLRKPWFKTLNGKNGDGVGTQDLYFWGDARKYGYRCAVDCGVKVGHYDNINDITW
jgi:hypothetical protein